MSDVVLERTGAVGATNSSQHQRLPALGSVVIVIEVLQAKGLVGKDRSLLTRKKTSDPFVTVRYILNGQDPTNPENYQVAGNTYTRPKTLSPQWDAKFELVLDADDNFLKDGLDLLFCLSDEDLVSSNDPMGVVPMHVDLLDSSRTSLNKPTWYPVQPGKGKWSCHNATGQIQLCVSVSARNVPALAPGNRIALSEYFWTFAIHGNVAKMPSLASKDSTTTSSSMSVSTSCVCVGSDGKLDLGDSVYFGNSVNLNGRMQYCNKDSPASDATFGEQIKIDTRALLAGKCYFLILALAPSWSPETVGALRMRVFASREKTARFELRPLHVLSENGQNAVATSTNVIVLARIVQDDANGAWVLDVINQPLLDVLDFGSGLAALGPCCPLLNSVDGLKPIAILRAQNQMVVTDFTTNRGSLPELFSIVCDWKTSGGGFAVDLDLCGICLDANMAPLETVSFRQMRSRDGALCHGGDAQHPDNPAVDVAQESIRVSLAKVDRSVRHIAFIVNSYSSHELLLEHFTCQLKEEKDGDKRVMAIHTWENYENLPGRLALFVGYLSLDEDRSQWVFRVLAKTIEGNLGPDNADQLQVLMGATSPSTFAQLRPPTDPAYVVNMPSSTEIMRVDESVSLPAFEFIRYMKEPEYGL
jgi:stress response protein SCP2